MKKRFVIFIGIMVLMLTGCSSQVLSKNLTKPSTSKSNINNLTQEDTPIDKPSFNIANLQEKYGESSIPLEKFLGTLDEIGSMISSKQSLLNNTYFMFTKQLQQQIPKEKWENVVFKNVDRVRTLEVYPVSTNRYFVELEVWVSSNNFQSIGYQDGYITIEKNEIASYVMMPENLLAMVNRIQAWPYNLKVYAEVQTHQHFNNYKDPVKVIGIKQLSPYIYQVQTQLNQKNYSLTIALKANRKYTILV